MRLGDGAILDFEASVSPDYALVLQDAISSSNAVPVAALFKRPAR
jgi:hypothetical protein